MATIHGPLQMDGVHTDPANVTRKKQKLNGKNISIGPHCMQCARGQPLMCTAHHNVNQQQKHGASCIVFQNVCTPCHS